MWNGINRRRFPRAHYPCKVTVKIKDVPDILLSETENIGIGGVCVMLPRDLGIFAPVDIQLDLVDGRPLIECCGTIVWIVERDADKKKSYDTGIEFTNLKRDDSERIDFIVEKILSNNK